MNGGRREGRFLLVALRDGTDVAVAEYEDFLRGTRLPKDRLVHHPITDVSDVVPDLSDFDGVFVGGSPFNVTDLVHSELQKHVHDQLHGLLVSPVPTLMLCYGNSFAAFAGGGRVDRSNPERVGVSEVNLTEAAASDPIVGGLRASFKGLTGHKESVAELPEGAVLLATGPTCPVQAYRANRSTWVTQFHPEMDADGIIRRMGFYMDAGYFKPEEVEEITAIVRATDLGPAEQILHSFMDYCLARPGR
ncbi:glutamine amidotransferase [uncultured Corynebacterium sp.]|uniref:glutamine amidotransferase n=1 Tax=uncultured Corynebacterium sp. TaxID=159447 RepID=UPI0025EB8E00|nr:glutamine amidotransferase [uncultured Corynebacterium sp.]